MSPHLVHSSVHAPEERPPEAPLVDFFGIGAPKCRTSWLARCLDEHPQVTIAEKKEPNFFVRRREIWADDIPPEYLSDWSWYAAQFAHARPGDVLGDFSVNLLSNVETAPDHIERFYPEARFLVLLRDPVARAHSEWWHGYGRMRHVYPVPDTFERALADFSLLTWRSRYHAQLSKWIGRFPKDRFLVLIDRDLDDAHDAVRRTYEFLDVDPSFEPPSLVERVNQARHRRGIMWKAWDAAGALRRAGMGPVINAVKRIGVERVLDRIDRSERGPPPLDPETAARLRDELADDIDRLEGLLDRDLTHWKPS